MKLLAGGGFETVEKEVVSPTITKAPISVISVPTSTESAIPTPKSGVSPWFWIAGGLVVLVLVFWLVGKKLWGAKK